jgi:LacI family transcriptional regulator
MDIRDIAKRAKVSTATVSRIINRNPTVDPQLAKRVWKVGNETGYYPNTQARALVSGRSRILGLIVSEITNPFFPEIVQNFENLAVANGYEILLTSTARSKADGIVGAPDDRAEGRGRGGSHLRLRGIAH